MIAQARGLKQLPQSARFAMMPAMPQPAVLICVAIQLEADAVAQALGLTFDTDRTAAHGSIGNNVAVELKLIGVGGSRMPARLDSGKYSLVISAGLAGALDPALKCGDVVVDGATEMLSGSTCADAKRGRIHHADGIVSTPAHKAELFARTGAMAIDMESEKIARLTRNSNVPFIAFRAISDCADEAVDPAVLSLVDPLGRAKTGVVLSALARRPGLLPQLLRLRSRSNLACERLGSALKDFLTSPRFS
jgi:nucleoside phosphorylase